MRLSEAFLQYILQKIVQANRADKTRRNYETCMNSMLKALGDIRVEFLSEDHIVQWRMYMERMGNQPSSISSNLSKLRCVLKYLKECGHEVINYRDIELPEIKKKDPVWLTSDEVQRILDVIDSPRDKAIFGSLFSTGARISELLSLNRDSIDRGTMSASILGKGDKPGTLYFHPYSLQLIDEYLATRKDSLRPLFISGQYRRITVSRVEQLSHIYADMAVIDKNVTPHVYRHSFATDLKLNGADIYDVKEQLRHSQLSSTQIYVHIADKKKAENHKKFHSGIKI